MAQNNLGGPGLGLPFPQALYPNNLAGIGPNAATNEITLAAGQALAIPPGTFIVTPGRYTLLQYLDPVTSVWLPYRSALIQPVQIKSDGQNYRLANLTGCPIGGYVTAAGSGYAQATTTITSSAGGSLWQPVIGGALNTSISIVAAGAGYTVPPMILIPAPPSPGIQATAYATITSGTVSAVTVTNQPATQKGLAGTGLASAGQTASQPNSARSQETTLGAFLGLSPLAAPTPPPPWLSSQPPVRRCSAGWTLAQRGWGGRRSRAEGAVE